MRILVTGGAGYIGSHMVQTLLDARHDVVVIDNLSTGHREMVPARVKFFELDVRDRAACAAVMRDEKVEAIFHFAARLLISESVSNPRLYWRDNVGGAIELLEAALDNGVQRFILSSTAATYGNPIEVPIPEDHPQQPVNPYGETKLAIERMLTSYSRAYGLRFVALRYFNAAGADPEHGLGEHHDPETHLIPNVFDAALGRKPAITVFGRDYATPDGTCVRDYVHVLDIAAAHLAALEYLNRGGDSGAFNLGTGVGHSVRQVIEMAKEVTGRQVPVEFGPRREGDPPELVARPRRAEEVLGWRARRASLREIMTDAWRFHSAR